MDAKRGFGSFPGRGSRSIHKIPTQFESYILTSDEERIPSSISGKKIEKREFQLFRDGNSKVVVARPADSGGEDETTRTQKRGYEEESLAARAIQYLNGSYD